MFCHVFLHEQRWIKFESSRQNMKKRTLLANFYLLSCSLSLFLFLFLLGFAFSFFFFPLEKRGWDFDLHVSIFCVLGISSRATYEKENRKRKNERTSEPTDWTIVRNAEPKHRIKQRKWFSDNNGIYHNFSRYHYVIPPSRSKGTPSLLPWRANVNTDDNDDDDLKTSACSETNIRIWYPKNHHEIMFFRSTMQLRSSVCNFSIIYAVLGFFFFAIYLVGRLTSGPCGKPTTAHQLADQCSYKRSRCSKKISWKKRKGLLRKVGKY